MVSFCLVIFLQYIYIYIYTYHKHYNRSYFSRPYSHFYIHVIYLFSIIYFMFTSYRPCFLTLTPDWLISYLVSHFNLSFCIYNFVHNTYVIHRLSLKKNGSPVRNIGFTKYFLTNICCAVILICNFQITYMA